MTCQQMRIDEIAVLRDDYSLALIGEFVDLPVGCAVSVGQVESVKCIACGNEPGDYAPGQLGVYQNFTVPPIEVSSTASRSSRSRSS